MPTTIFAQKEVNNMELLKKLIREEEGQTVTEYTLMIGLAVLVLYAAIAVAGIPAAVSTLWTRVSTSVTGASS